MIQFFVEHLFGCAEVFALVVMSYDHYTAICKPLYCMSTMNRWDCGPMVGLPWEGGFLHSMEQLLFMFRLPLYGPNVIDHFFCDTYPLLELDCTDTYFIGLSVPRNGGAICAIIFLLLLLSYAVILRSLKSLTLEKTHNPPELQLPRHWGSLLFHVHEAWVHRPPISYVRASHHLSFLFLNLVCKSQNRFLKALFLSEFSDAARCH
ncbi:olfactory receptor 4A8-like [Tachyglossus aculeatus]|uniref:olfactory receptor 4A8-like n=1 Tax=Tachyglossus aculeatus TaxID=9261 RepID=UPI0018F75A56|nr:olfactory receptor 4A8-like [Tachyglossus aculeatus]